MFEFRQGSLHAESVPLEAIAREFGIDFDAALDLYRTATRLPQIDVVGIDCHIGSDLIEYAPLIEALDKMLGLVDRLAAEIMVDGTRTHLVRERERPEALFFLEHLLPQPRGLK